MRKRRKRCWLNLKNKLFFALTRARSVEKLLLAWQKVCAEIEKKNMPTESEKAQLTRMTPVFDGQVQNALSMTAK